MGEIHHNQHDYESIFHRICDSEKRRHRSVKLIRELSETDPINHRELLDSIGYSDAEIMQMTIDGSVTYKTSAVGSGGFAIVVRLPGEIKVSNLVFLRIAEEIHDDVKFCFLIGFLLHEMGHVDDIEKGKFIKFEGFVDIVAAEEYAHRYALRRMMREKLRLPLGCLLGAIFAKARDGEIGSASKEAASRIITSGEYKQFREFVGNKLNVEAREEQF